MLRSLAIVIATFVVFSPVLGNHWVSWDDPEAIVQNEALWGPSVVSWAFTTDRMSHFQPLSWLLWGLTGRLFGVTPRVFHGLSLALHLSIAVLLYFLMVRLSVGGTAAAVATLFYALHPLRAGRQRHRHAGCHSPPGRTVTEPGADDRITPFDTPTPRDTKRGAQGGDCARRVAEMDREIRAGTWRTHARFELAARTLGIVGLGGIGRATARLGAALGLRVIGWNRGPVPEDEAYGLLDAWAEERGTTSAEG